MLTNGFVSEVFDISVAKISYVGWAFSILFSIPFFVIASYFSCMAIGAVTDSSRVKKLKYLRWCILQFFVCQVFF